MRGFYEKVLGMTAGETPAESNGAFIYDDRGVACDDFDQYREHLQSTGVPFVHRLVESMNLRQIFVHDPNGITIELNFRG